jgi:hypothetical protein
MQVWIELPEGWKSESSLLEVKPPAEPESRETRNIDFELGTPVDPSVDKIKVYALYYVCEDAQGQCLYRRQNLQVPIRFRD